ncbi:ESX secretion-associated protein EspG [Mycolicibacterium mageritense]|uniref:ESX secretion-associated protein EspG n=1 Tax=Mycolicibacterium mageritense TaxID=53462 RepID=UPI0023F4B6F3|nr:ESX secretion-associated protein EspG [Mycolicibacterium mageritense]
MTFPGGMWVLQSKLGLETMPLSLRLAHYIPSGCDHIPVDEYPEYQSLVDGGIIGEDGTVNPIVDDWLTVVSRADLEVQLTVRRPGTTVGTVAETVTVICRLDRWIVGITRAPGDPVVVAEQIGWSGDPAELPPEWVDTIRVFPIAEVSSPEGQAAAISAAIVAELGSYPPAHIDGFNIELDAFLHASAAPDTDTFMQLLARQGVTAEQIAALSEIKNLDNSALAVVSARHVWPGAEPQDRAVARTVSIADTAHGRISMAQSISEGGTCWVSVWPGHHTTVEADITGFVTDVLAMPAPNL